MPDQKQKNADPKEREKILRSLYPIPKTYDQIRGDVAEMQMRQLMRQPKYICVRIALELTALFALFLFTVVVVPQVIMWNVLSGVPIGFLLGMIIVGLEYWEATRISGFFNAKGFSAQAFLTVYFTCAVLLFSMRVFGTNSVISDAVLVTALILAHFGIVWFLSRITISKQLSPTKKLTAMFVTFFVLLVASLVIRSQI